MLTEDTGSVRSLTSWAPWQSAHVADLFSPFSMMARLWIPRSYIREAPGMPTFRFSVISGFPWHRAQVAARLRK